MIRLLPLLLLAIFACKPKTDDTGTGDTDTDSDGDSDSDVDTDTDSDTDGDVPSRDPDYTYTGNLSEGEQIDLDFASYSTVACWPGNDNENFTGNHVFYTLDEPANRDFVVRVRPEASVDVSVYGLQFGQGDLEMPPDVTTCWSCEAGFDYQHDDNPGEAEVMLLQGYLPFEVVIGVAGAQKTTEGAYTLEIWDEEGGGYDTAR